MKLYTLVTRSHRKLYRDFFLPSLPEEDGFELVTTEYRQIGPGSIGDYGWAETMAEKIRLIQQAIRDNRDHPFVWSDCDVQFFKPVKALLLDAVAEVDLAAQRDGEDALCAGFFICHANDTTKVLFDLIAETLPQFGHMYDQEALNRYRNRFEWCFLPDTFYTVYQSVGGPWEGGPFSVPEDIVMHHANWTVGVKRKVKLLSQVRAQVRNEVPPRPHPLLAWLTRGAGQH
jgi:hypothetical protein